jgi:hypothetical protein
MIGVHLGRMLENLAGRDRARSNNADRANISARLMVASSNDNARNTDDEDAAERPDPIALLRRLIRDY